jgi:four helix bundle protein
MATAQKFEDLSIWQKARIISKKVHQLTFTQPLSGDFRLKDQMRGSSGSIMDNIAEGFDRGSRLEFVNLLIIKRY